MTRVYIDDTVNVGVCPFPERLLIIVLLMLTATRVKVDVKKMSNICEEVIRIKTHPEIESE